MRDLSRTESPKTEPHGLSKNHYYLQAGTKKETTLREILGFQIWLQSQILLIQSSTQIHLSTQIQVLFIHSSFVGLGFLSLSMKEKEKIVFIGLNWQTP